MIPRGSLRNTGVLAVTPPTFALAGFQLRLHLDDGLMLSDEPLFGFSYLLLVALSSGELSNCCMVLLIELDLPIVQDLADALRACSGDRCCGVSSRTG